MTKGIANRAYDILVNECGAKEDDRGSFVHHYTTNPRATEWRFQGDLGFGGKFRLNDGRAYVSCYLEDHTLERNQAICRANEILDAVVTPYL